MTRNIAYYIDASVLLENNQWHIFHILTSEDIDDVIYRFLHWIYMIKRKLHGGLKIWILSSRDENNILYFNKILVGWDISIFELNWFCSVRIRAFTFKLLNYSGWFTTSVTNSIPILSLSSALGALSLRDTLHIHSTILISVLSNLALCDLATRNT